MRAAIDGPDEYQDRIIAGLPNKEVDLGLVAPGDNVGDCIMVGKSTAHFGRVFGKPSRARPKKALRDRPESWTFARNAASEVYDNFMMEWLLDTESLVLAHAKLILARVKMILLFSRNCALRPAVACTI